MLAFSLKRKNKNKNLSLKCIMTCLNYPYLTFQISKWHSDFTGKHRRTLTHIHRYRENVSYFSIDNWIYCWMVICALVLEIEGLQHFIPYKQADSDTDIFLKRLNRAHNLLNVYKSVKNRKTIFFRIQYFFRLKIEKCKKTGVKTKYIYFYLIENDRGRQFLK